MAWYLIRRVAWVLPVMLGVATLTFFIMHFVPGGPWDGERKLPPETVANLNLRYGLDDPVWHQYWTFLSSAVTGDLGISYGGQDRKVSNVIAQGIPASATLGALAFLISLAVGIPLGLAAALQRGGPLDYISNGLVALFAGIPGFVLAILLVVLFSLEWHLLPTGGWGSPSQAVMPALALAAVPAAFIARITRAAVLDVVNDDFIRTARAKGLPARLVNLRHVLRNALIPILTLIGPELAALITGSLIIESVFSIPGTGRLFVQGVFARDYSLIMGMVLFYAALIAVVNLAVDLLYAAVDPRIRRHLISPRPSGATPGQAS